MMSNPLSRDSGNDPFARAPDRVPDRAIELIGLTKVYQGRRGEIRALDAVDLTVKQGEIFGLLGPNGAGKSTLINIVAGLVNRTSGSAAIWGYDIDRHMRAARRAIGIVPQELNLDPFFTPRELLEIQAGLYGVPKRERRTGELLKAVGLEAQANAYARSLSGGMRRRLLVAKALVHAPPVLVLDEPTAGVDVELRQQLWNYVRELNARGTTVLLTTHYLHEAEELCDRIAIIDRGKVVVCDTTAALVRRLDRKTLAIIVPEALTEVPVGLRAFAPELSGPHRLVFHYRPSVTQVGAILAAVGGAGLTIADLTTEEADLEEIFLQLTRRGAEPAASTGAKS